MVPISPEMVYNHFTHVSFLLAGARARPRLENQNPGKITT